MKNIYQNLYNDKKNAGDINKSLRIKIMLAMADGLRLVEKNILDIGCYDGTFLSLIKSRENDFFGLDANNWSIEKSLKKGIQVSEYFFNDTDKIPYRDNFFDLVVAGEIIEHIYDTDFFLEEVRRVLKPEGKLILSTPNIASLGRRLLLLLGRDPLTEISPNEAGSVGHIRYFTFKTLKQILEKHKFRIVSSQSDCINFSRNGGIRSAVLAKLLPTLGASVICLARKK